MITSKLISTVSWNTPDFLKGKLYDLVRQNIIEYAHWIWHEPESDQSKAHAHLIIKPNKRLDTSKLRNEFVEPIAGEEKPRGVNPFVTSKIGDWVLYGVHDVAYLLRKCQTREHHYEKKDILTTEPDLLDEHWRDCHEGEDRRVEQVIKFAQQGLSWFDVLQLGIIPINQLFQYRDIFFTAADPHLNRNGRTAPNEKTVV
jgi:hypothetical protein